MTDSDADDSAHFGCNKCFTKILRVYIVESLFYCESCAQIKRDEYRLRDAISQFESMADETVE